MSELTTATPLPPIPNVQLPDELQSVLGPFLDAVKERLEIQDGTRGFPLDRTVTQRDLYNSGLATVVVDGVQYARSAADVDITDATTLLTTGASESASNQPDQPKNLTATGALANVILSWDESESAEYAFTEIWRAGVDDQGQAVRIGTTTGTVFSDPIGNTGATRYYWVRFVSIFDQTGPFNSATGAAATTGLVTNVDLAAASVTTAAIANLAVDNSKLGALAVDAAKLATSAVTATKIANAAVGTAAIANAAVGSAQIASAAITTALIANAAVTNAQIGALAVDTAEIAAGAITNAKIGALAVDTAEIADLAVTSLKIGALAVTTLKIGDDAVTLPDASYVSGTITLATTFITIGTLTHVNTGDGSPWPTVLIGSANFKNTGGVTRTFNVRLRLDGTTSVWGTVVYNLGAGKEKTVAFSVKDSPVSSGSYVYDLEAKCPASATDIDAEFRSVVAIGMKK